MLQVVMYAVQPFKKKWLKQNTEECKKQATSVVVVKAVSQRGTLRPKSFQAQRKLFIYSQLEDHLRLTIRNSQYERED